MRGDKPFMGTPVQTQGGETPPKQNSPPKNVCHHPGRAGPDHRGWALTSKTASNMLALIYTQPHFLLISWPKDYFRIELRSFS